jgi:branched-chain amino acid aminotransferase
LLNGGEYMSASIENRYIWLNGKVVPLPEAKINVLAPTSQYGLNVFEGIRCYWNDASQQLYAFRLDDHYKRLKNSIKMFRMEDRYSVEELKDGLIEVVRANQYKEDIAVRQTVFVDGFGTWSSTGPVGMFIAPVPKSRIAFQDGSGLRCCVTSWERINDRNISPRIKAGANYINSRMGQLEALENGYDSAIFMNNHGKIAEGPGSCFFMVRDGVLITPPCTASVLESITSATVIELARSILNIDTVVRDIDRTELYICDEAFLCGSAMEIAPVINIDGYEVGVGKAGMITKKIHTAYIAAVSGQISGYAKWLTEIY